MQCQQLHDQARGQQRPLAAVLSLQAGRQCRLRGQQGPALQQIWAVQHGPLAVTSSLQARSVRSPRLTQRAALQAK